MLEEKRKGARHSLDRAAKFQKFDDVAVSDYSCAFSGEASAIPGYFARERSGAKCEIAVPRHPFSGA